MALKRFYQVLSIISAVFGIYLILGNKIKILGNIIGISNISPGINLGFGIFFFIAGLTLFAVQYIDKKFNE